MGSPLLNCRLSGPLAASGFLWGASARSELHASIFHVWSLHTCIDLRQYFEREAAQETRLQRPLTPGELGELRMKVLKEDCPPDARRAASAVVCFPGGRTAAADDDEEDEKESGVMVWCDGLGAMVWVRWVINDC